MTRDGIRIAMWSGPRNISTALMRAWDSRGDTSVWDEPFYAAWLARTGATHPGREEVLAAHETDPARIVARVAGPIPGGRRIWYQKHMAHHLLPEFRGEWLWRLRHAFLVREPRAMLASLARVVPAPGLDDTGLPQQLALLRLVERETGRTPPVVVAGDVLRDPGRALARLCGRLGVPYDDAMLSWAPGPRSTDGAWARHWYGSVEASSGFRPYAARAVELPAGLAGLLPRCEALFDELVAAGRAAP